MTPTRLERRIVKLRYSRRWGRTDRLPPGGAPFDGRAGAGPLPDAAAGPPRPGHRTGGPHDPVRRYERTRPGELVHVDVKKLGRIRPGGGHRAPDGRPPGGRSGAGWATPSSTARSTTTAGSPTPRCWPTSRAARRPGSGVGPRPGSGPRAWSWTGAHRQRLLLPGAVVQRGPGRRWHRAQYCRPYRPQTNGKVERFHRTLVEEWAYASSCLPPTNHAQPPTTPLAPLLQSPPTLMHTSVAAPARPRPPSAAPSPASTTRDCARSQRPGPPPWPSVRSDSASGITSHSVVDP